MVHFVISVVLVALVAMVSGCQVDPSPNQVSISNNIPHTYLSVYGAGRRLGYGNGEDFVPAKIYTGQTENADVGWRAMGCTLPIEVKVFNSDTDQYLGDAWREFNFTPQYNPYGYGGYYNGGGYYDFQILGYGTSSYYNCCPPEHHWDVRSYDPVGSPNTSGSGYSQAPGNALNGGWPTIQGPHQTDNYIPDSELPGVGPMVVLKWSK